MSSGSNPVIVARRRILSFRLRGAGEEVMLPKVSDETFATKNQREAVDQGRLADVVCSEKQHVLSKSDLRLSDAAESVDLKKTDMHGTLLS